MGQQPTRTGEQTESERAVWRTVQAEMDRREWSKARLSRESGVSRPQLIDFLVGKKVATWGEVVAVSLAFGWGECGLANRAAREASPSDAR